MVTELFPEVTLYAVNPSPGGKQKVLMRQHVVATISVAWQRPWDSTTRRSRACRIKTRMVIPLRRLIIKP